MRNVCWNLAAALGLRVAFFILMTSTSASAQTTTPIMFDGVDISAAVKYYSTKVTPLKQSITVYHWGHHGPSYSWDKEPAQGSPELLQIVKNEAKSFWRNYGILSSGMLGSGLYTAIDPVATFFQYGSGTPDANGLQAWLLQEITFPVGIRLLDIGTESPYLGDPKMPGDVNAILDHFDCPSGGIRNLFNEGGIRISMTCRSFVKIIFSRYIPFDGLAYPYDTSSFIPCTTFEHELQRAIIIATDHWITPDNVKFYTSKTSGEIEGRTRIQTTFIMAEEFAKGFSDHALSDEGVEEFDGRLQNYLSKRQNLSDGIQDPKCGSATCTVTVTMCDVKGNCKDVNFGPFPKKSYPTSITKDEANGVFGGLLWPDLEGKPKTKNMDSWLQAHMFGCSGKPPYRNVTF
jgi:hypothetical protein